MPMSYGLFFTIYSVTMIVGIFIGVLLIVGWRDISWRKALRSVRANLGYLIVLIALPLLIQLQGLLERLMGIEPDASAEITYTTWIFNFTGNAVAILQDRLDYRILADASMLVYAWVFTFLLYFTPILLLVKDDRPIFKKYTLAMVFNYIVLIPFYVMFPVTVSGSYPEAGITPLLYVDTHWGKMVTSVDPLDNDFPSGHVSMVATTLLIFASAGREYRRFYQFLVGATVAIVFSVVYLGVHWPADVVAGFVLALGAVWFAGLERVQRVADRAFAWLENVLVRARPEPDPGPPPIEDAVHGGSEETR